MAGFKTALSKSKTPKGSALNTLTMDTSQLKTTIKTYTKDEINEDAISLIARARTIEGQIKSQKAVTRVYKKALTAPILPDDFIKLQSDAEVALFQVLIRVKDNSIALSEILYNEMMTETADDNTKTK